MAILAQQNFFNKFSFINFEQSSSFWFYSEIMYCLNAEILLFGVKLLEC